MSDIDDDLTQLLDRMRTEDAEKASRELFSAPPEAFGDSAVNAAGNIVSLADRRQARAQEEGESLHAHGEAFAFEYFDYDDYGHIGRVSDVRGDGRSLLLLINPRNANPFESTGYVMTRESARKLAKELLEAADDPLLFPEIE